MQGSGCPRLKTAAVSGFSKLNCRSYTQSPIRRSAADPLFLRGGKNKVLVDFIGEYGQCQVGGVAVGILVAGEFG